MRFQASVGNTTYILEEQSDRRFVKLTRFNSTELKTFEFFDRLKTEPLALGG